MQNELKEYLSRIAVFNEQRYSAITSLLDELGIRYEVQEHKWETKSPVYQKQKPAKSVPAAVLKAFSSLIGNGKAKIRAEENILIVRDIKDLKKKLADTGFSYDSKHLDEAKDVVIAAMKELGFFVYEDGCTKKEWKALVQYLSQKTWDAGECFKSFCKFMSLIGYDVDGNDEEEMALLQGIVTGIRASLDAIGINKATYAICDKAYVLRAISSMIFPDEGKEAVPNLDEFSQADYNNLCGLLWEDMETNDVGTMEATLFTTEKAKGSAADIIDDKLAEVIDLSDFDAIDDGCGDYFGYPAQSSFYASRGSKKRAYGSYTPGSYGYNYGNYGSYGGYSCYNGYGDCGKYTPQRAIIGYETHVNQARNIIIPLSQYAREDGKKIVLMAHYDAVPGSTGANDNGSGVAILIAFAKKVIEMGSSIPMEIVFTDKEESGGTGCRMYLAKNKGQILEVINLDTCGVGEDIVTCDWSVHPSGITWNLIYHNKLQELRPVFVRDLPYCDANLAHGEGLPVTGICTLPPVDVLSIINGHATYTDTYKYMHNGEFDDIKYCNYRTMEKIVEYLMLILE